MFNNTLIVHFMDIYSHLFYHGIKLRMTDEYKYIRSLRKYKINSNSIALV